MKSISLGQYFCSLLLITLIINVIAIVSAGPLAGGRGLLEGLTFRLQPANENISGFSGCRAELQKYYTRGRLFFQKIDKPVQNCTQAHRSTTAHTDGAMPMLNGTSRIAWHAGSGSNSGSGWRSGIQQWLVIRRTRYKAPFNLHIPGSDVATCTVGKRKWTWYHYTLKSDFYNSFPLWTITEIFTQKYSPLN